MNNDKSQTQNVHSTMAHNASSKLIKAPLTKRNPGIELARMYTSFTLSNWDSCMVDGPLR